MAEGDTRVKQQGTGRRTVKENFVVDDAMVADFREQLKTDHMKMDDDGFKKDYDFIGRRLDPASRFDRGQAVRHRFDARRHLIGVDPQAQVALAQFGEAQKLLELSKGSRVKASLRRFRAIRPQWIGP